MYETDGVNAAGVHEWSDVRLLAPVGTPPSIRLFSPLPLDLSWEEGEDLVAFDFQYLNPAALIGPGVSLEIPAASKAMAATPCLAAIIGSAGRGVSAIQADGLVLGLCPACSFYLPDQPGARSRDVGFALGPAITTPDELDDSVTEDERGRRYRFGLAFKVNSEEIEAYDLNDWPKTLAEIISFAAETATLQQGDVIAISLASPERPIERGDQVQVTSDKLGALTIRI